MAYRKDVWRFPGSNEYEYKFIGNYGAKGEKRHKKQKASPEQIRKKSFFRIKRGISLKEYKEQDSKEQRKENTKVNKG